MNKKSVFKAIKKRVTALGLVAAMLAMGVPVNTVSVSAAQMTIDPAEYPFESTIPAVHYDKTTLSGSPKYWTAYTTIKDIKSLINQGKGKYSSTDNSSNASKGTITPDMCFLYPASTSDYMSPTATVTGYAKYGTNIGSKSEENEKIAEGEYVLAIRKGSDTISYRFSVRPVKRIDWPTALPNTEYLSGIDWDLGDTSFKVTYTNGASSTIQVTKSMLYLAETCATAGGPSDDGTVIGAQSVAYNSNMANTAGYYRMVIKWNGYNSASNYSDNTDAFQLWYADATPSTHWDGGSLKTAQGWYKWAQQYKKSYPGDYAAVVKELNARTGKVDTSSPALYYYAEQTAPPLPASNPTDERTYTTYVIDSNAPKYYDVTVYVPSAYIPEVKYSAHVQNIGWQGFFYSPETAGTTGQSKRMEALMFDIENYKPAFGNMNIDVHVQNKGDLKDFKLKDIAGTTGQSLRLEAVTISFTGQYAQLYSLRYRVHIQNQGWSTWYSEGQQAGTTGKSLRLEAIEVKVETK